MQCWRNTVLHCVTSCLVTLVQRDNVTSSHLQIYCVSCVCVCVCWCVCVHFTRSEASNPHVSHSLFHSLMIVMTTVLTQTVQQKCECVCVSVCVCVCVCEIC